jgi:hypothetical protein
LISRRSATLLLATLIAFPLFSAKYYRRENQIAENHASLEVIGVIDRAANICLEMGVKSLILNTVEDSGTL